MGGKEHPKVDRAHVQKPIQLKTRSFVDQVIHINRVRWERVVTLHTMWHVYRTATSNVTASYKNNVANTFKVNLGLRLPGKGWKVSIVSAMLPKMALFKDMQDESVNLMELWAKTEHASNSDKWKKGKVKASNLKAWEKSESCGTTEEFFNCVKHRLEETAHAELDADYKIDPARWIHLEWDKKGAHPELVIKKTTEYNTICVYKPFADVL